MRYLSDFLEVLDQHSLLKRIPAEVSSELEITEIVNRLYSQSLDPPYHPVAALLFEKVKDSRFPLVINLLGTDQAIELLLKGHPEDIGGRISKAVKSLPQAGASGKMLSWLWQEKDLLLQARSARTVMFKDAPLKEVKRFKEAVNLNEFPIMKCWPLDGGKFITAGLVITKSPITGIRNTGIYRLQMLSKNELIVHWQIQKGGGFHYTEAVSMNQPLEVAVVIGTDPLLWLAGIFPLPEEVDELAFAGFLSGQSIPMVRCETVQLEVPASAEIVIEGIVRPERTAMEGPFGDHFGHYSHAAPFPVLEIQCITHKKNAIYHSAVVGKPPQEDKAMGETVTKLFTPIIKVMRKELEDIWAYHEAGFHNLLVASVRQRYGKEAIKTALALLGEGQMSLSKCVILVDPGVNVRHFPTVLKAIHRHFNPREDFILLPGTAQDTLDFTGHKMNYGSKMILDATGGEHPHAIPRIAEKRLVQDIKRLDKNIIDIVSWEDALLLVQVKGPGKEIVRKVIKDPELSEFNIAAVVSEDVPLQNPTLALWGLFTRFDCERDVFFTDCKLEGVKPIYSGLMGIDATWKPSYPNPVEMLPNIIANVSQRWKDYGFD